VSALRERPGGDIYIYGSLTVARALLVAGLVDELVLFIEPITLGGGKTLFPTDGEARKFELTSATTRRDGCAGVSLPTRALTVVADRATSSVVVAPRHEMIIDRWKSRTWSALVVGAELVA
jgi:hypothetical protein